MPSTMMLIFNMAPTIIILLKYYNTGRPIVIIILPTHYPNICMMYFSAGDADVMPDSSDRRLERCAIVAYYGQ